MRTVSLNFREAAYSQQTGEIPVLLLTITHDSLSEPLRFSTDNADEFTLGDVGLFPGTDTFPGSDVYPGDGTTSSTDLYRGTISNSDRYLYMPMQVSLPSDTDEAISSATITVGDVSGDILSFFRSLPTPPDVVLSIVLASSPDFVECAYPNFVFESVQGDAFSVTGVLSLGYFLDEPCPGGTMSPSNFPGLF